MPERLVKTLSDSAAPFPEAAIEIVSHDGDVWKVKILFPSTETSDREMLARMRESKLLIADQFDVPAARLEFRELLEKNRTPDGIAAQVLIGVAEIGRGKPVVRLKPMETGRGEVFHDMIAEIDFFCLDEFDQPITRDRLRLEISRLGIDLELCNMKAIEQGIETVRLQKSRVNGLEIARGRLPEIGRDAELEYTFFTDPAEVQDLSEYRSGRKVKEKDIICQKIPPAMGKRGGYDVRGQNVAPIGGLDFQLVAGEGTKLSLEGTTLTALRDGIPIMSRTNRRVYTLSGEKVVPEKIEVKVKPLMEVNAEDVLNLALEESVEILGNLKAGSSIRTRGEVFLEGDLTEGVSVLAGENVLVNGEINGGEISADSSVYASRDVKNAKILAGDDIQLKGIVQNSVISGRKVKSGSVKGSKIEAGQKVFIQEAGNDTSGRKTTIRVGRDDFYRRKLESNKEAIEILSKSIERIRKIFGDEVIRRLSGANHQQLLVEYMKRLHGRGYADLDEETIEPLRKLLSTVNPLQSVIAEKEDEIKTLQKKASDESAHKPIVVIRERIQDPVDVVIHDKRATVGASQQGTAVTISPRGDIKAYDLPEPSSKKTASQNLHPGKKRAKPTR